MESIKKLEKRLFSSADALRGKIPPSEYKFYVLPILLLRYINITKDKYKVSNEADWNKLISSNSKIDIKRRTDNALKAIKLENNLDFIKDNLYTDSNLSNDTIKSLLDLFSDGSFEESIKNNPDVLGTIYEYFIGSFASEEGNRGGEFFTPTSIVDLLVRILKPVSGTLYDPACGTGGMFINSRKYNYKLRCYGQEQVNLTIDLAKMNAFLHNMEFTIAQGDTLLNDKFIEMKFDYILSNPPFNLKKWGAHHIDENDPRVIHSITDRNANYMWIQHIVYHLKDDGKAAVVIANGALTTKNPSEASTRELLIKERYIEAVIQLPNKMFANTGIPCAVIIVNKNKKRKNAGTVLFIDASELGTKISKSQNILNNDAISTIEEIYNNFSENKVINHACDLYSTVNIDRIMNNEYRILPSMYTIVENIYERPSSDEIRTLLIDIKKLLDDSNKKKEKLIDSLERLENDYL